ncbi:phosphohistidine phosphatase SixA [Myxacorys almedinensis]|uniref:Phosphohistidine phosphatase SixA n=1 Tax=Myxacorys almedinensis A TaxID=2690445 RepID=A0A8J7YZK2_9CYAN|nr:phosphohistidine phosphatase SixA [Myxacorys almedinensis]NDJ17422.1 phosphohistidine phosphatase SixA [Myxacorys almedinensis A]
MDLYFIRHGLAGQHGDYANDRERPLTDEGKRKTRQVAQQLHGLGLRFDLILTSPLARAKQTAEILRAEGLGKQLEEAEYLAPGGDLQPWLNWLGTWRSPDKVLALVGHEPDLSTWAELLVWGNAHGNLVLKKAGAIAVTIPDSGSPIATSRLFWLTSPRFLLGHEKK